MRNRDHDRPGRRIVIGCLALAVSSAATLPPAAAQRPPAPPLAPTHPPSDVVDLMTAEGTDAFGARWKTMEAKLVEVPAIENSMPGYEKTYDIFPHAGEQGFDDSSWPTIEPKGLADRRGGGKVSFIWYRTNLTVPAKAGNFDMAGARAVLAVNVDDYAEIWVNGQMPRRGGSVSPATIQGFGMTNRVVLADSIKAGDIFQIAIFGVNGPISVAGDHFVFFRQALIELYK
jgi:gluconolactonase